MACILFQATFHKIVKFSTLFFLDVWKICLLKVHMYMYDTCSKQIVQITPCLYMYIILLVKFLC